MKACSRKVYEVLYRLTIHGASGERQLRDSMRVLATSGLEAANAVDAGFPGWWTRLPDTKDTLSIEGVQCIVQDIRYEVEV